jgi:sec-independent protein translocase protein TatC
MKFNFEEDLKDLKKSILIFFIPFIISIIGIFIYSEEIINLILKLNNININSLITISPLESIQTQINTSLTISLAITIPLLLYSIYSFIEPVLKNKIKIKLYVLSSIILSWTGFIIGSTMFSKYLIESFKYYQITGMMWSIKEVLSLIMSFGIAMSFIFQTIIIIPLLVKSKIVSRKSLIKYSLIVFLFISLLSAIITPPDIFSQIIVCVPFYTSFWIGIIISKFMEVKQ